MLASSDRENAALRFKSGGKMEERGDDRRGSQF